MPFLLLPSDLPRCTKHHNMQRNAKRVLRDAGGSPASSTSTRRRLQLPATPESRAAGSSRTTRHSPSPSGSHLTQPPTRSSENPRPRPSGSRPPEDHGGDAEIDVDDRYTVRFTTFERRLTACRRSHSMAQVHAPSVLPSTRPRTEH